MIIKAKNTQHLSAQGKTYLSAAGTAGQTVFDLKNVNGFDADLALQIGEAGNERSEVLLLSGDAASGKGTVTAGAAYPHPVDTPVYCYRFNQVVFLKSTAGTAGTAAAITNGTVTITPDSPFTVFDDTAAESGHAWKTKFYNSALDSSSPESDWITFSGYPAYSLAGIRNRIFNKLPAVTIDDDTVNDWVNEWRQEMVNAALSVNEDYSMGTIDVGFSGTTTEATITASDFVTPRRVWLTTNGTDYFRATRVDYNEPYPNEVFNSQQPRWYMRGDNVIGRLPHDSAGTARIAYDSIGSALSNDGDELPLSMRGYSKSFVDYGVAQAYRHPSINDKSEANRLEERAFSLREDFVTKITPRTKTNTEYIDIVESDGIEQEMIW